MKARLAVALKPLYFLSLGLISLALVFKSVFPPKVPDSSALPDFILGRWVGPFPDVHATAMPSKYYQLEFVGADRVIVGWTTQQSEYRNLVFHYQFVSENQVRINARAADELRLDRDGEDVLIHSSYGLIADGLYRREPTIEWPLASLLLGMATVGLLFVDLSRLLGMTGMDSSGRSKPSTWKQILGLLLKLLVYVVAFGVGLVCAYYSWQWGSLQWVRIPWDAVILSEVGTILFILGAKLVWARQKRVKESAVLPVMGWSCLGAFLLGNSFVYLVAGLLELGMFVFLGSYGYGA